MTLLAEKFVIFFDIPHAASPPLHLYSCCMLRRSVRFFLLVSSLLCILALLSSFKSPRLAALSRSPASNMVAWLRTINPIPSFPSYTGPYTVGTVDVEIAVSELTTSSAAPAPESAPSTVAFRVFYPCSNPSRWSNPTVHWVQSPQHGIISAYGRFLGAGSALSTSISYFSSFLCLIKFPAHKDAPVLKSTEKSSQWPVTVFSHGLGGTRNSYSHFCGSMASYGVVVVAPDHRDGSAPISYVSATDGTQASEVGYRSVSHQPSRSTYDARDDQLKIRLWEMGLIHEALEKINRGDALINLLESKKIAGEKSNLRILQDQLSMNEPGKMSFAGHSFGAATAIQFVKSVYYSSRGVPSTRIFSSDLVSPSLDAQITPRTPLVLLDPWGLPLSSPNTSKLSARPLPCFDASSSTTTTTAGGSSVVAILSEAFYKWSGNLREIKQALADPRARTDGRRAGAAPAHIFYPERSAHLSQSDFGILFPNITKYFAKADEPERTMTLNVRAALQVLRNAGVAVAQTSRAAMEVSTTPTDAHRDADDDEARGDWRILSNKAGQVRGWISLSPEESGGGGDNEKVPSSRPLPSEVRDQAMMAGNGELKGAVSV